MTPAPGWHVHHGSDAKGRRVVADRAYRVGEVVLEDDAAAWCLTSERLSAACDCCLAPAAQPLRCGACRLACYAGREHQRRAWQAGAHKLECAALRACAPRVPPTAVRLALRCVLRHWQATCGGAAAAPPDAAAAGTAAAGGAAGAAAAVQHSPDPSRLEEVLALQSHWGDLQEGALLECAQMGAAAHGLLAAAAPGAAEAFGPRQLAELIARFGCNSHTVSDDELVPLAVGVFPLGAMVNHDCAPNAVHAFRGGRMVFRAVRPITPGEEVTTAYVELAAPRWERRAALLRHHQFDIDAPQRCAADPSSAEPAAAQAEGLAGAGAAQLPSGRSVERQAAVQAVLDGEPQQRPDAVERLPGGGGLRLYACPAPPWPHDARDAVLTEVVRAAGGGAAAWGGMWGSLGQSGGRATATQSFGVDEEAEPHVDGAAGAGTAASPDAATIHCWAAGLPGGGHCGEAEQLAARYAAALRLQRAVDGQLGDATAAAAAADRLGAALASLTGGDGLSLGPRHVLCMRLLADAHRVALAAGRWEDALSAARRLLPLYEFAYQPVWPQLGLLHASAAKLAHLLERPAEAVAAAQAAVRILAATHGDSSAVVGEMRRVAFEAEQELRHRGGAPALAGGGGEDAEDE